MREKTIDWILWAAFLVLVCGFLIFHTSAGRKALGREEVPEFVLTYAENQAEDYPTTQGAYRFAQLVHEKTEGKVEIQVNAGGSMGDEKAVIEQLQFGGVDLPGYPCRPWLSLCPS